MFSRKVAPQRASISWSEMGSPSPSPTRAKAGALALLCCASTTTRPASQAANAMACLSAVTVARCVSALPRADIVQGVPTVTSTWRAGKQTG